MTVPARPPAVAGQFYEGEGASLAREIEGCFLDRRGPGRLPTRQRAATRRIRAAIVPHAGYRYSGAIAAQAFDRIAADAPAATVLVLGVDHHGIGAPFSLSDRPWRTPLGEVPVDHALVRALDRPPLVVDEAAQRLEHSIEVELPFLQYVEPAPRIVALQVRFAPFEVLRSIGERIRDGIAGRDVLVIASTDLSHYVPPAEARRMDRRALDQVAAGSARGLYETVVGEGISMCGIAPTTVLLTALAGEPVRPRVLGWGHSGEVEPMGRVVGYAAAVIERDEPPGPAGPRPPRP